MGSHVLIFPLPLQGPINCMLKLAEILCLQQIKVTLIITEHIKRRLFESSGIQTYMKRYGDAFSFESIPDGLPQDHPRTIHDFSELLGSLSAVAPPILHQFVSTDSMITCIVAEGIFTFATDIAAQIGVPLFYFDTYSPCALWANMCLPQLIQAGDLPFKDDNLDGSIRNVPGMEGIMRRRDLPSFCRGMDLDDIEVKLLLKQTHHMPLSQGIILNTFHQLDAPILSHMLKLFPNIYAIGPLHTLLQTLTTENNSSSIWQEDRTFLAPQTALKFGCVCQHWEPVL